MMDILMVTFSVVGVLGTLGAFLWVLLTALDWIERVNRDLKSINDRIVNDIGFRLALQDEKIDETKNFFKRDLLSLDKVLGKEIKGLNNLFSDHQNIIIEIVDDISNKNKENLNKLTDEVHALKTVKDDDDDMTEFMKEEMKKLMIAKMSEQVDAMFNNAMEK